ncbi:MAG: hypothetical protein AB1420_06480 [Bacillota bacterium]
MPKRCFEFVKTQDPALIENILVHNKLDLLSLSELIFLTTPEFKRGSKAKKPARRYLPFVE